MRAARGARSNDNNPGATRLTFEPTDHAVGRSRGGLSTKVHLLVDDAGRPLVIVVSPGQAGDNPALQPMLNELRIARRGPGRPRARPVLVRADKAYSARGTRGYLRRRGIKAVIPIKKDQDAHRKNKGSKGGRPITHDPDLYRDRNTVERRINKIKDWRGLATRYDKTPESHLAGPHLRGALIWIRSLPTT